MRIRLQRQQPDSEELIGRRIALISMTVGVVLSIAKILVGVNVGSAAVTSDGIETAGDVLSSAIVYAGLWLASKPPDLEHPYGHGRYETLAGLAVGAMLLLTSAFIFWEGFVSLGERSQLQIYALYPLLAGVIVKIALASVKFRTGRRIASASLEADGWHDVTDLLSTSVALFAVILTLLRSPSIWGRGSRGRHAHRYHHLFLVHSCCPPYGGATGGHHAGTGQDGPDSGGRVECSGHAGSKSAMHAARA